MTVREENLGAGGKKKSQESKVWCEKKRAKKKKGKR